LAQTAELLRPGELLRPVTCRVPELAKLIGEEVDDPEKEFNTAKPP
jgi:hypothetical protein